MKKKKKEKKILYQLIFSAFLLFSNAYLVKANSDILSQDSTGKYCINTEQDYYNFIENIQNYNNKTVILCNDIDISDVPEATSSFGGILNGKGHTITYASKEAKENIAVFPFRINDNGIVENINVQIDESYAYNSETDEFQTVFSQCDGIAKGITIKGNVTCIYDDEDEDVSIGAIEGNGTLMDSSIAITYDLQSEKTIEEIAEDIVENDLEFEFCQLGTTYTGITYQNCIGYGQYSEAIKSLADELEPKIEDDTWGSLYVSFTRKSFFSTSASATNCYYDKENMPDIKIRSEYIANRDNNKEFPNYADFGKTTSEMKNQGTYEGFDFNKKWTISPEDNNGYPYYNLQTEEITLKVQASTEPKVWSTSVPRDYNRFVDYAKNYHFPYQVDIIDGEKKNIYDDGDNNVVNVIGVKFTDLTDEQQSIIEKYGIEVVLPSDDVKKDIKSATIDTSFLGERPLSVEWINMPILKFKDGKEEQAEEDGYSFKVEVVDGTGEVVDNGAKGNSSNPSNWPSYYEKAKKACNIIMNYCQNKNAFGSKESPSYENTDIWAIFTAARCGYIPYGDTNYFDKWFANTKEYLQLLKNQGTDVSQWKTTELSKLILAIEAIGYDPRDISSVDLLSAVGSRKSTELTYTTVYAINAIKAGGYTADTFKDTELNQWAHDTAKALSNAEDKIFANADNTIGWQPLIFWYKKPGYDDVTEAVDKALHKLPAIAQRSTGSFCTPGFETGCMSYGNNAWNDAQAMLFAGTFGVNVLDSSSGYTKNGNNILDAFFDLVDVDGVLDGSIHGFTNYDVPQIARGLDAFIRQYENTASFWEFTDVKVPTKSVNDMILALNDNSTKEEIEAARNAYNALDEKHKAIFNKDTLRKLLAAENGKGDSITKVIAAIDALPAADKLTLEDKDAVVKARNLYDALDDEAKSVISNYSKLTEAEARIKELEKGQTQKEKDKAAAEKVVAAINALPSSDALTLDPYVLQLLDNIQAEYNALTEAQKALVTNYSTLQYLRNLIPDLKAAAAVVDKIKAIGEVTSDNYQKKQALVIEARTAYDALTADQKKRVTNYAELEKAELFIRRQSTDAKVGYVISFIDELNITTSSTGALSDGPLKLTEKNNNVPTEKIWNSWKDYVANARVLYNTLDDQQKAQVTNLSSLEKAEGYLYQLKSDALKAMLKALPDAETVRAYEAPQPTTVPAAQEAVQSEELPAQEVPAEGSDFSDGSADAFTSDISEQPAAQMDIQSSEDIADVSNEETPDSVIADEAEVPDADFSTEEEIPAAGDTAKRALTETELKQIAAAKNAYDQLTETEETKFRSENTALVENMEKLIAMALTYEKGQNEYQQLFADEAALIYATVKDHPVDRDSYPQVKAFLDRYAKDYQGQENAMAGLKVKVGNQEMTFAEVIAALTAQADKAGKDISDAQQADDWISNLPTAVTKENIAGVEAELAALQKLIDSMSAEGKSYMWNAKQLELIKTIVADYHIELAGKQDAFKADMPANLQTKALNYKTIQVSWSSVDNADGYIVYRRTETGSWKKIADQVTDIFYKDQKAVTGRVYYYTVRAYSYTWGGKTVSSYNKDGVIGKATLGKVKIATAASENYNTIRVTWNKVFGANGYRVYRSTSKNGKYTSIGSTAKNSAVTFLDKKAVTGTTYYYKGRAYRNVNGKKVYGSYSIAVKGKAVLSAPSLSVGSTSKTAVLEWSRVKAADGYQVYASASKNGKYTRIKTTKGTGMTEEKLATGKTRYYKVRAYRKVNGKTVYGSFSKVKKVVIK